MRKKVGHIHPMLIHVLVFPGSAAGSEMRKQMNPGLSSTGAQLSLHLPYAVAGDTQPQTAAFYCPFTQVASLIKRLEKSYFFRRRGSARRYWRHRYEPARRGGNYESECYRIQRHSAPHWSTDYQARWSATSAPPCRSVHPAPAR